MFMQPIDIPVIAVAPARPAALKLAVGALFSLAAIAVMPVYLAGAAVWMVVASAAAAIAFAARFIADSVVYAGEAIVGR